MKSAKCHIKFVYFKGIEKLRDSHSVKTLNFPNCYSKDVNAFNADRAYDYYIDCCDFVFLDELTRAELKIIKGVYR